MGAPFAQAGRIAQGRKPIQGLGDEPQGLVFWLSWTNLSLERLERESKQR